MVARLQHYKNLNGRLLIQAMCIIRLKNGIRIKNYEIINMSKKEQNKLFMSFRKRLFQKQFFLIIPLSVFLLCVYKLQYDHIGSFSFGDEYNSFVMGYFMQKGRILYSQIFTNHQVL